MERALMQRAGSQQLSSVDRFGCAAVAGAVSALVASPTELIIIQQQVSQQQQQQCGDLMQNCHSAR
jgi:hypothetical protein